MVGSMSRCLLRCVMGHDPHMVSMYVTQGNIFMHWSVSTPGPGPVVRAPVPVSTLCAWPCSALLCNTCEMSPDHQTIHPWVMTHVGIPVIGLVGHDTHRHLGMPCPSVVCFFCTCGATVLHCILYVQATQHCACHSTLRIVQDSASPHSSCLGEYPPIQMVSISSWVMTHVMSSPC